MATLNKGTRTITVPDGAAASYLADGWKYAGEAAPAPTRSSKPRRRAGARRPAPKPAVVDESAAGES